MSTSALAFLPPTREIISFMKLARPWWLAAILFVATVAAIPEISLAANEATGTRFAVATESEQATRAAMQTLRAGGHAVDAAIAATLVLGGTHT